MAKKKAADGKAIRARRAAAAAALVAVLASGAGTLFLTAPAGTAADVGGDNPAVMGAGGEHYGEGWNNYGHALDQPRTAR